VDTTVAALGVPPQRGKLKIWILVLAIVGGFVLLLLLVLLLWAVSELTTDFIEYQIATNWHKDVWIMCDFYNSRCEF